MNRDAIVSKTKEVLESLKLKADRIEITEGPAVYTAKAVTGIRLPYGIGDIIQERLDSMIDDPARVFECEDGLCIEIPKEKNDRSFPAFRDAVKQHDFADGKLLPLFLGYDTSWKPVSLDLAKCRNILISGATMQGNGVLLKTLINSLLLGNRKDNLKLFLADSKVIDFDEYKKLDVRLLWGDRVLWSSAEVNEELASLCKEMDVRSGILYSSGSASLEEYRKSHNDMPDIVVVISDYADYMGPEHNRIDDFLHPLVRIAQKGPDVGIHCIVMTQRPSPEFIPGMLKVEFPTVVATRCPSANCSITILGQKGAERLLGKGDMLLAEGAVITRFQGLYEDWEHTSELVTRANASVKDFEPGQEFCHGQTGHRRMPDEIHEAASVVIESGAATVSFLQRKLGWSFSKAARTMDALEMAGIVGPCNGGEREILIDSIAEAEIHIKEIQGL